LKKTIGAKYNKAYIKHNQNPANKTTEQETRRIGTSLVNLGMKIFHELIRTYKNLSNETITSLKTFSSKQNQLDSQVKFFLKKILECQNLE